MAKLLPIMGPLWMPVSKKEDDLLIPSKAVFLDAGAVHYIGIGAVHIHELVPLGNPLVARHHLHKAPGAIPEHRQPFVQHDLRLLNMLAQVVDAIDIVNLSVEAGGFAVGHAILGGDHR